MVKEELIALTGRDDYSLVHENSDFNIKIYLLKIKDHSHNILFTEGMTLYNQDVNEENADLQHIELYFYLPEYWNLETDNWPIYWLNRIAEVPQKNQTWFGHGDTGRQQFAEIDVFKRYIYISGFYSGQVKYVIDQFQQMHSAMKYFLYMVPVGVGERTVVLDLQQLGKAENSMQRCSQFVAHTEQKL